MFKMRARIGGSEEYCSSFLPYRIKGEESLSVRVCVRAYVRACMCVCVTTAVRDGKEKAETDKAGVQQRDRCVGMV